MKKLLADMHMHTLVSGHAYGTIREMAAGILPESLIVLYHGERLRRKTAKNTGASAPVFFVLAM